MITLDSKKKEALLHAIEVEKCKKSFYHFFQTFWPTIIPDTLVLNWHMEFICNTLQSMAERVFAGKPKMHDLIINISPGSTKSTICSIMFPAWVWTRMKNARFITSSYAYPLSLALSTKCRDVVTSELYHEYFPDLEIRADKNAKGLFGLKNGGDRYATSTTGSVTGFHGHFIIVDDALDPRGVRSKVEIVECNNWYDATLSSRKVDKDITPTIIIMQRLGMGDLTDHLLEKNSKEKPIRHICLPCDNTWPILPKTLANHYDPITGLMDANRLSKGALDTALVDLGPREYAGQYGQSPKSREGNMFEREKFNIVDKPPCNITQKVRYWDKAATEGGVGAQTAGVLMGLMSDNTIIVLDCIAGRWSASKREDIIYNTALMDGIETEVMFEQEAGSGGKESAENTYKRLIGYKRGADHVTGDKITRAEPWSVEVNHDSVYLLKAPWNLSYISEHEDFPQGKIKDKVDASSGAYNRLAKLMKRKNKRFGGW
jgi:predicted phage terminase large subunit-like protein